MAVIGRRPSVDRAAVFVAVLVVFSGCAGLSGVGGPATEDGDGPRRSVTSPPATPATDPLVPEAADRHVRNATVVDVVDGDTLDVRYANGTADTVRLLGVDTPEVHTDTDPAEFEGVPDTAAGRDCLRAAAEDASEYVRSRLSGADIRVVVDPTADRRDRYDRLLAYVVFDNRTLNYRLVARGHARVYDTTFEYAERFYTAEERAQTAGRGLWRCRDLSSSQPTATVSDRNASLSVVEVHADAAGNDHENLDDEYVVFRNQRAEALSIAEWTVEDAAGHSYTFPAGATVAAGATVTLYTGTGPDGDGRYYWDSDHAVWNNDGDTVVVRDATGTVVERYQYG
jgi:micrococcal nuclease